MVFTIINSEKQPLEDRGYIFSEDSRRVTDYAILEKIENEKGSDYTKELANRFMKEEEPICKADDGFFYCVLFEDLENEDSEIVPTPVMWQSVSVKNIMHFTIINSEKKTLAERGYAFAENSKRVINYTALEKITVDHGEEYAESLTARFLKEQEPICMGSDGVFYCVLFETLTEKGNNSTSQGIMWQEISVLSLVNNTNS